MSTLATTESVGHVSNWTGRVLDGMRALGMRTLYAMLGIAGLFMWLLMQLPIGGRAKETLVYVMAGCLGIFALGWGLMRQLAGPKR